MKEKFAKALYLTNKFIQSDWFILFTAILVFIGWCFNAWVPILCILVVISTLPLFFSKQTKHLLVILMTFTLIISSNRHALEAYAPLLALIIVLFAGIIFNLVRFRRKREDWQFLHPTKIKGFHCTLIALIVPFALGGVGSPYEHPIAVVAALALVVVMALGYTFLMATNRDAEDRDKLPEYLIKILFVMGIIITLQLVVYYARLGGIEEIKKAILAKEISLGWASKNNVAPTLSMCIPAGFYFCIKKNKLSPIFAIISLLEFALLMFTGSRGAIMVTVVLLPAMLLYTMAKTENKVAFGVTVCAVFCVAFFIIAYYGEFMSGVIDNIIGRGLDSSGRVDWLYPEAVEAFKQWPIFGAGWDYRLGELASSFYTPYWYHSTALQILATMGIVGVITFVFFYFWRYRTLLAHRKNPAFVALLAALFLFDAYGMVDTNFFGPTFFIMLLCISFVADVTLSEDKCRAFGGRNPFLDIANGCQFIITSIKTKINAKKATANGTDVIAMADDMPIAENSEATAQNEISSDNGTNEVATTDDMLITESGEGTVQNETVPEAESVDNENTDE